jgi:hypothetical protein
MNPTMSRAFFEMRDNVKEGNCRPACLPYMVTQC